MGTHLFGSPCNWRRSTNFCLIKIFTKINQTGGSLRCCLSSSSCYLTVGSVVVSLVSCSKIVIINSTSVSSEKKCTANKNHKKIRFSLEALNHIDQIKNKPQDLLWQPCSVYCRLQTNARIRSQKLATNRSHDWLTFVKNNCQKRW